MTQSMKGAASLRRLAYASAAALCLLAAGPGCGSDSSSSSSASSTCGSRTGSAWVPNVAGVSNAYHDASVSVTSTETAGTGTLIGLSDDPMSKLVSVSIPVTEDLGAGGSLSLVGQVTSFPSELKGSAFAVLVSLHDGVNDLVGLTQGTTSCTDAKTGFYCCTSSSCTVNTGWNVSGTSAYASLHAWEQHQTGLIDVLSSNTFPTCNWSGCVFADTSKFPGKKLRTGTYTAKYALVASNYSSVTAGRTAGLKVTAIKKTDATSSAGAVDFNVVLVGSKNITDSRTDKGKANLNALLTHVASHYGQSNTGIKLGNINVIEWDCESGDAYATVGIDKLADLYLNGSAKVPSESATKAVNLFLVSTITGGSSSLTIAGIAGGIGGPMINGTGSSGVAIALFDQLAKFNSRCTGTACDPSDQDASFKDLGATISHESGHFLGLNHPSESTGTLHDPVPDTPVCTTTDATKGYLTAKSCRDSDTNVFSETGSTCLTACPTYDAKTNFCPSVAECQFNHIMWWTGKNYSSSSGDGNLFSPNSSVVLNYSPYVR